MACPHSAANVLYTCDSTASPTCLGLQPYMTGLQRYVLGCNPTSQAATLRIWCTYHSMYAHAHDMYNMCMHVHVHMHMHM